MHTPTFIDVRYSDQVVMRRFSNPQACKVCVCANFGHTNFRRSTVLHNSAY